MKACPAIQEQTDNNLWHYKAVWCNFCYNKKYNSTPFVHLSISFSEKCFRLWIYHSYTKYFKWLREITLIFPLFSSSTTLTSINKYFDPLDNFEKFHHLNGCSRETYRYRCASRKNEYRIGDFPKSVRFVKKKCRG